MSGLAVNPAAPADVLLELLAPEHEDAWSALAGRRASFPGEVAAAIVAHPDVRVRKALARNPYADPEVRGLLVDDPEWIVRGWLAGRPDRNRPVRPLPDWVIDRMLTTYDNDCLSELFSSRQIPFRVQLSFPRHPVASVRRYALNVWGSLTAAERAALLDDPHPEVRAAARNDLRRRQEEDDEGAMERRLGPLPAPRNHGTTHILVNCRLSGKVVDWLVNDPDRDSAWTLAHNYSTPPDVVASLVDHPDPGVRRALAARDGLPPALVEILARDHDPRVRTEVSLRPELSEDERAAIDYVVEPDQYTGVPWEPHASAPADPAVSAAQARSGHPLRRRRAATDPALPTELVTLLAHDDDAGVRLRLAHHHPAAPPHLLLDCYLSHPGPDHHRALLTEHPNFPTTGLGGRFATADTPAERHLALLDPDLAADAAERLTHDTDAAVRAGAAAHPRLPAARLTALLDDTELGPHAAANPALPATVMRDLLS
ncbi:translation initiation factor 2 [Streptomyces sp. N35]|uniref:translation initiation factor 2 n=1 Tax=Streptomyces sp. N35 TaxID=2795730 RepID=UPI001F31574D|nr:translation initiation factor 2 [Streptomyces sp. N35]